jgi:hypothetical protein
VTIQAFADHVELVGADMERRASDLVGADSERLLRLGVDH